MSSARISASVVLPKLVRSPHSTQHVGVSRDFGEQLAIGRDAVLLHVKVADRRHPHLAVVTCAILFFEIAYGFGKAPLLDVDRIVARREDAAAADLLARPLDVILVAQPLEQLVHASSAGPRARSLG